MEDKVEVVFSIPYLDIPITNVVVMSWIIMAIIILWAIISTRKFKMVPKGLQNTAEIVVEFFNNFVEKQVGNREEARKFAPYIGTIGLFLVIGNTIGALFMVELTGGLVGPVTRTIAIPVALAIMTIVVSIGAGIRKKGIKGFMKRLLEPTPIMLPFNILDFIIKPMSLALRLFGNICGAFIVMELLLHGVKWVLPAFASMYLDLFDGGLQAFVFVLLSTLYIAEEVHMESHEETNEEETKKQEEQLLRMGGETL